MPRSKLLVKRVLVPLWPWRVDFYQLTFSRKNVVHALVHDLSSTYNEPTCCVTSACARACETVYHTSRALSVSFLILFSTLRVTPFHAVLRCVLRSIIICYSIISCQSVFYIYILQLVIALFPQGVEFSSKCFAPWALKVEVNWSKFIYVFLLCPAIIQKIMVAWRDYLSYMN